MSCPLVTRWYLDQARPNIMICFQNAFPKVEKWQHLQLRWFQIKIQIFCFFAKDYIQSLKTNRSWFPHSTNCPDTCCCPDNGCCLFFNIQSKLFIWAISFHKQRDGRIVYSSHHMILGKKVSLRSPTLLWSACRIMVQTQLWSPLGNGPGFLYLSS